MVTNALHYCPSCGHEMSYRQLLCPECDTCCEFYTLGIIDKKRGSSKNDAITPSLVNLDARFIDANTQWRKYWAGKDGLTGHGFAAEDANAFWDRMHFRKVSLDGRNNALDGPDRIVNGELIQTKYCRNANSSINAAFKEGHYRYFDASGKPMTLEVPKDQYDEAVKLMEQKIKNGELGPSITDPSQASQLVKQGKYTLKQAQNIARSGNIDSLKFDAQTGAVFAIGAFTISFIIDIGLFAFQNRKSTIPIEDIVYSAIVSSLQKGVIVFSTHVVTQQLLRTQFVRNRIVAVAEKESRKVLNKIWSSKGAKNALGKIAKTSAKNSRSTIAKRIGTGVASTGAILIVAELPVVIKYASGSISARQASKDSIVTSFSILGALISLPFGGWVAFPIGIAGSVFGGKIGGMVSSLLGEGDSQRMQKLVQLAEIQLAEDYLLYSKEEMQYVQESLSFYHVVDADLLVAMYKAGKRGIDDFASYQVAYTRLEYYYEKALRKRSPLELEGVLEGFENVVRQINIVESP